MTRILTVGNMYPPHHLGGYELMWRSSVHQLRDAGHEISVLTTDYRRDEPEWEGEDADVHRDLRWYWADHDFPRLSWRERLRLERHNLVALNGHLERTHADLVCWWAMGGMSLSMLERVREKGIPALGVVVDDWLVYGPRVDAWHKAFSWPGVGQVVGAATSVPTRFDIAATAKWLFVSKAVTNHAIDAGLDVAGSPIAPGGIDPRLFEPAPSKPWHARLLYLGRIDERKGIANVIRALEHLPQASLRIVGAGDSAYLRELRDLVAKVGAASRVRFDKLPRERVAEAYAEADATIFPVTWQEPWGLVPLESMAVGTPVIATGSGGSGEYLRDRENCLIFSPADDPSALASAVRRLGEDEPLRAHLREEGFSTSRWFTESRFNQAVTAAIERVAG